MAYLHRFFISSPIPDQLAMGDANYSILAVNKQCNNFYLLQLLAGMEERKEIKFKWWYYQPIYSNQRRPMNIIDFASLLQYPIFSKFEVDFQLHPIFYPSISMPSFPPLEIYFNFCLINYWTFPPFISNLNFLEQFLHICNFLLFLSSIHVASYWNELAMLTGQQGVQTAFFQNYYSSTKLLQLGQQNPISIDFFLQIKFMGWAINIEGNFSIYASIIIYCMTSINPAFLEFVQQIETQGSIPKAIEYAERYYNLRTHKISQINVDEAKKLYESIYLKFYKGHSQTINTNWYENELRIFVWALVSYIYLKKCLIQDLGHSDWHFFAQIFDKKDPKLFQYQCQAISAAAKGKIWQKQEEDLLRKIMQNKINTAKWNEVSKELFQLSDKKYFRTAKQCRERWNNHLDPSKIKGFWKAQQCLLMFQYVKNNGKKWANLVKILNYSRNEHSIKNKFNSIIKKHRKTSNIQSNLIYDQIINRIKKTMENRALYSNADISFDIEELNEQFDNDSPRRFTSSIDSGCHSVTRNFLKLLQNFNPKSEQEDQKQLIKVEQEDIGNRTESSKTDKICYQDLKNYPMGYPSTSPLSQRQVIQDSRGLNYELISNPILFYRLIDKSNNSINFEGSHIIRQQMKTMPEIKNWQYGEVGGGKGMGQQILIPVYYSSNASTSAAIANYQNTGSSQNNIKYGINNFIFENASKIVNNNVIEPLPQLKIQKNTPFHDHGLSFAKGSTFQANSP